MKRLIILMSVLFFVAVLSEDAAAVVRLKVKPVQFYYQSNYGTDYSIGVAFESAGEHGRFGMQHNLDLDFQEINPLLRYKADFKIYLLDDAPKGLYIAPYFTIGATTAKYDSYLPANNINGYTIEDGRYTWIRYGAGAAVGYQFMFADDKFSVEAQMALGMGGEYLINDPGPTSTIKNNDIGFGMIPHLAFGFHFG